jgi:ribosome assembly protein YihI (activator of Der GTPase)
MERLAMDRLVGSRTKLPGQLTESKSQPFSEHQNENRDQKRRSKHEGNYFGRRIGIASV